MKKLHGWWLMALLMMLPLGFASCDDDDELGSRKDLVGTWESVQFTHWEKENGKIVFEETKKESNDRVTFHDNGTYSFHVLSSGHWTEQEIGQSTKAGSWTEEESGKWEYKDGKIYLTFVDNGQTIHEDADVKVLTGSRLVIEDHDVYQENGVNCEDYEWDEYRKIK